MQLEREKRKSARHNERKDENMKEAGELRARCMEEEGLRCDQTYKHTHTHSQRYAFIFIWMLLCLNLNKMHRIHFPYFALIRENENVTMH